MTASRYRIVLRGRLSERFESAFEGMALEPGPNQTVLVGDVRDQAHLYGLLDRLRDFGIDLLAVPRRILVRILVEIGWRERAAVIRGGHPRARLAEPVAALSLGGDLGFWASGRTQHVQSHMSSCTQHVQSHAACPTGRSPSGRPSRRRRRTGIADVFLVLLLYPLFP